MTGRAIVVSRDPRVREVLAANLESVGLEVSCHDELPALASPSVGGSGPGRVDPYDGRPDTFDGSTATSPRRARRATTDTAVDLDPMFRGPRADTQVDVRPAGPDATDVVVGEPEPDATDGVVVGEPDDLRGLENVVVCVVDRDARRAAGPALRAYGAPVVVVGDDLADDGLVALMLDAPVSHVVSDPADRHVGIASEKLASGNYFGLEKYLAGPDSAEVGERRVGSQEERRFAVGEVCAWAEAHGARRAALHRITSVVDELLMNALREAPGRAVVRWACDRETLAISVGDPSGALAQRDVIDNVRRARGDRGRPRDSQPVVSSAAASVEPFSSVPTGPQSGAGLGLYLVLANVASLIVNIERGRRTEVVCLFDRSPRSKAAVSAPRSFHVFAND